VNDVCITKEGGGCIFEEVDLKDAGNGLALAGMLVLEHGTPHKMSGTTSMTTHQQIERDGQLLADCLYKEEILNLLHSMSFYPPNKRCTLPKKIVYCWRKKVWQWIMMI
jgi:hypothetical protein